MTNAELYRSKTLDGFMYRLLINAKDWLREKCSLWCNSAHWNSTKNKAYPYWLFRIYGFIEWNLRLRVWQKRKGYLVDMIEYGYIIPEKYSKAWQFEQSMKRVGEAIERLRLKIHRLGISSNEATKALKAFAVTMGKIKIKKL